MKELRQVTLDYCQELLTNRPPNRGYENDLLFKRIIHRERMVEYVENSELDQLPMDIFVKTYNRLAKSPGDKYRFIMKAGCSMKPALFNLCDTIWRTENLPTCWNNSAV